MNLALIGPAGTGKGTLGKLLASNLNLSIFDTGARLRAFAAQDTPEAREVRERLAAGLMTTELAMRIMEETIPHVPAGSAGWLLDGSPRSVAQAEHMLSLKKRGILTLDRILVLDAPRLVLLQRLQRRQLCDTCGTIYNQVTAPPPAPGRCTDACGGKLYRRPEDNYSGIMERFRLYDEVSAPAVECMREAGVPVTVIDTDRSLDEIWPDLLAAATLRRAPRSAVRAAR